MVIIFTIIKCKSDNLLDKSTFKIMFINIKAWDFAKDIIFLKDFLLIFSSQILGIIIQ